MPLPDERPRQSVANLIGRFEQQQKRQPTTPGPPSRTTSAASNNTGDPAKEEQRIVREWPPVKTNGNTSGTGASGSLPPKPAISPAPLATTDVTPSPPPASDKVLPGQVDTHPAPMPETSPAPTPPTAETEAIPANDMSAPPPASITAPVPATKTRSSASTSRSAAAAVSKPMKTPASPSKSTPSTGARPSPATTSRVNRAKTPTPRTPPKGPGTRSAPPTLPRTVKSPPPLVPPPARPKTPASKNTAPRASLPTSGLFAPTAASLAKARNTPAPPPPPSVPRKVDLSRLSKPTAASAGKVRTLAAVVSPPRPSGRGTVVKRGSSVVSRGACTTARSGGTRTGVKKAAAAEVAGVVSVGDSETSSSSLAEQQQPGEEDQPSHDVDDSLDDSAASEVPNHEDAAPSPDGDKAAESEIESAQLQNLTAEEHPGAGDSILPEQSALPGEKEAENSVSETEAEAASEREPEGVPNAAEPEARLDEVKPRHATVGNDLETIVTMLQGPSFPASTHLDVAGEIPDEE